jgi:hypothetical protein
MKLMSLAATTALVLISGSALSQQPHREFKDDNHWALYAKGGVPGVYLSSAGTNWAQRIDFATASGTVSPGADFATLPGPPLVLDTEDPLGPPPRIGDTGAAMAHNIATDNRLAQLGEVLAVPEPSALLMMLAGLGAIVFVIRRRINDA